MNENYRGGNSRALGRALDQLQHPVAALDRRGLVLFVNQAMCQMLGVDAGELTGLQCSWQIADDSQRFAAILTALAPPAGALQGKVVARQLTAPIVFGSTATGQLFLPLVDEAQVPHVTLVILGDWEHLQQQLPERISQVTDPMRRSAERTLVELRSRWATLDQLLALVGQSPAIKLAMSRAQLAIHGGGNCLITGPKGCGKSQVISGIHVGRLRRAGLQKGAGQWLPLDCRALTSELFPAMLDVFVGRLRDNIPAAVQMLVLDNIDALDAEGVELLLRWLPEHQSKCVIGASSLASIESLRGRGRLWEELLADVAHCEIQIPALHARPADIPAVAQHLLSEYCKAGERAQLTLAPAALDLLTIYPWPDNLRQISAAIEFAVQHAVLTASVQPQHLPVEIRSYPSSIHQAAKTEPIVLDHVLEELEKTLIRRAVQLSPRNRAQVARLLGISRPRLLRRLEQLGIDTGDDESVAEEQSGEPE